MSVGDQTALAGVVSSNNGVGSPSASAPAERRGSGATPRSGPTPALPARDEQYESRNLPLAMLDVPIGTMVVRTENCSTCGEDTLQEQTYLGANTWQSDCTKHRDPSRQKTSAPYSGWRKP